MRSYISASERLRARGAIVVLLAVLVVYFALLEVTMRLVVPRLSAERQRQAQDYHAARALQPSTEAGAPSVLVVGNSLLLHGVSRTQLGAGLAPRYAVQVFPIQDTTYLDWYFALRRLFAEGSRPAVLILCMNVRQLVATSTDGEAFAHDMMRIADLPQVKRAAGLDMMAVSDYFLANLSSWIGGRAYLRNGVLDKWLPRASVLAAHFARSDPTQMTATPAVMARALAHLRALQALCRSRGIDFIMLIPPALNPDDPAPDIAAQSAREGITVLVPYLPGEMPRDDFSDGLHLNPSGAALFTGRLDAVLPGQLQNARLSARLKSARLRSAGQPSSGTQR